MTTQGRRGFLKRMGFTFAMFEAAVMKEVGVTSPTSLTALPQEVYLITTPSVENSDEGWFPTDGSCITDVFIDRAAADAQCRAKNRAYVRSGELQQSNSDNMLYLQDSATPETAEFQAWLHRMEQTVPDLADYLKRHDGDAGTAITDLLADDLPFLDDDAPDELVDKFLAYYYVPGVYEVSTYKPGDLDPELLKKLDLQPSPPGSLRPAPSGTPAATALA